MKSLTLFRHAKTERDSSTGRDFDRRLAERGEHDSVLMGEQIRAKELEYDLILCSPAKRAAETAELAGLAPRFDNRIYDASAGELLAIVQEQDDDSTRLLMIGHNPGFEDLIFDLVPDDGSSPLRDIVEEKLPTASFAVLELDCDSWSELRENSARLVHLARPRDLDPELGPELAD